MTSELVCLEAPGDDAETLIADTARGVFADIGSIGNDAARAAAESASWFAHGWKTVAEIGFLQAMRSEEEGGVGLASAMMIVRLSGAAALALPLVETMAADWLLASAGLAPTDAPTTFVPGMIAIERCAGGVRVSGAIDGVPWARACDLVGIGMIDERPVLVRLARGDFSCIENGNLAGEPRDCVRIDTVVDEHRLAALPAGFDPATPHRLGAVLRVAQLAGAAEAAVEMTVSYARERSQFGRTLSQFQAVQQLLAISASEAAAAGVAADIAAASLARGLDMASVATAKIRAGEAAGKIAAAAHQIHGAIGFTREYALQLLTRRLLSWRDEFGTEAEWSIALGRALARRNQPLWAAITDI